MNEHTTEMLKQLDEIEASVKKLLNVEFFDELEDEETENLMRRLNIVRGMAIAHVR